MFWITCLDDKQTFIICNNTVANKFNFMGFIDGACPSAMNEPKAKALVNVFDLYNDTIFSVILNRNYESEDDVMVQFGVGGPA